MPRSLSHVGCRAKAASWVGGEGEIGCCRVFSANILLKAESDVGIKITSSHPFISAARFARFFVKPQKAIREGKARS